MPSSQFGRVVGGGGCVPPAASGTPAARLQCAAVPMSVIEVELSYKAAPNGLGAICGRLEFRS